MEPRTEIASLGEFGLIEHLTRNIELQQASTLVGVGDDAAVIDHFGKQTVISTDLLIEGVHFDLMYTPLKHLGYKSVVVNLSDVFAMNATPTQITLSIGFSNRFSVEALDEFYEGVYAACSAYGVDLVGGAGLAGVEEAEVAAGRQSGADVAQAGEGARGAGGDGEVRAGEGAGLGRAFARQVLRRDGDGGVAVGVAEGETLGEGCRVHHHREDLDGVVAIGGLRQGGVRTREREQAGAGEGKLLEGVH